MFCYCIAPFVYCSHTATSSDICQSKVGVFEEQLSCYLVTLVTCILLYMLNIYHCSLFGQHLTCSVPVCVCVGRAEKRFLAFQNKDSFWYLSSIFCKQTLSGYEQNFKQWKHFEKVNPRYYTLYFGGGAILISRKIYISMHISKMALSVIQDNILSWVLYDGNKSEKVRNETRNYW